MQTLSNILDQIHDTLPSSVWDDPGSDKPHLKPQHRKWIEAKVHQVLKEGGYTNVDEWLSLVLTGSLTTYQYGRESDCDVSLFVDSEVFPEWSRAEMIGLMVSKVDGTMLPGTTFPMQCFVVPPNIKRENLYKPGLRSGYDLKTDSWVEPPDRGRVHNVEQEENASYVYALESADKMERLLKYEPDKAVMFWHQIHKRRRRDQVAGKGDFAESNIVYKFLANRGLMPSIAQASGEYIARYESQHDNSNTGDRIWQPLSEDGQLHSKPTRLQIPSSLRHDDGRRAPMVSGHNHSVRTDRLAPESIRASSVSSAQSRRQSSSDGFEHTTGDHTPQNADLPGDVPFDTDGNSSLAHQDGHAPTISQSLQEAWSFDNESNASYPLQDSSLEISSASEISEASGEYIAKTAAPRQQKIVTKFIYDPVENHLVLGNTGREEGEHESHYDLINATGMDRKNAVFGQFDQNGRVQTFGRPKIRGFGKPDINQYEADYRLKKAIEATVPGTKFDTFDQGFETEPPQVTYMGEPPKVAPNEFDQAPQEEGVWTF